MNTAHRYAPPQRERSSPSVPHQLRGMASLPSQAGTGRQTWDGFDNAGPDVYWPVNHTRHARTAEHR